MDIYTSKVGSYLSLVVGLNNCSGGVNPSCFVVSWLLGIVRVSTHSTPSIVLFVELNLKISTHSTQINEGSKYTLR